MTDDQPVHSAPWSAKLPRMSPVRAFATILFGVFLLIFLGTAILTFLLPETYAATVRLLAPGAEALSLFESTQLLKATSQQLNLPTVFGARYGEKKPLEEKRVEDLLRRSVRIRPMRGKNVIEIRVWGRSPSECAQLANTIADVGVQRSASRAAAVKVIEPALPPLKPSRPNKTLNLLLGAAVGLFLGVMAGGVGAKLATGFDG